MVEGEELSQGEKVKMNVTDIAKKIKSQLNEEYPSCKFSVTTDKSTGSQSITVSVMEAGFKVLRDFGDLSDFVIKDYVEHRGVVSNEEELKQMLEETDYFQLATTRKPYNPNVWNNGAFLTKEGHQLVKKITEIADQYNYDNSNRQSGHYDVNFHLSIQLGKYDRPFEDGGGPSSVNKYSGN